MNHKSSHRTVYAIVVTYNGAKWIDKCFGSLINSSIPLKILAIDNDSNDNTPDIIRKRFPCVEVIETGKNLGFGKANNIGLKRALKENADYIFLLNQDAWIEPNTINNLINIHKKNLEYTICAPIQLNGKGELIDHLFLKYTISTMNALITKSVINTQIQDIYEAQFINAACWLLPRQTLIDIGGFDPLFTHYGEDDDYINRIHQHGFQIGLCPEVLMYHDRENRELSSADKITNKIFVNYLANFKLHPRSLLYFRTKQIDFFIKFLILRLSHYKHEYQALGRFLKVYRKAKNHCDLEKQKYSHYLD